MNPIFVNRLCVCVLARLIWKWSPIFLNRCGSWRVMVGCGGSGAEDRQVWSFGLIYGFDCDFNFVNLWVSGFGWP